MTINIKKLHIKGSGQKYKILEYKVLGKQCMHLLYRNDPKDYHYCLLPHKNEQVYP